MSGQRYMLSYLSGIFHTGVFCLQEKQLISYEENSEYNPIYVDEAFRLSLAESADAQKGPVVINDDFHMFYICVKWKTDYYIW